MKRNPQLRGAPSDALEVTPSPNIHESAFAVMVLNGLLHEKLERVLPDYHPGEHTTETIAVLVALLHPRRQDHQREMACEAP